MDEKKQNDQNAFVQSQKIFEIRTMKKDQELRQKNVALPNSSNDNIMFSDTPKISEKTSFEDSKNSHNDLSNPFLSDDVETPQTADRVTMSNSVFLSEKSKPQHVEKKVEHKKNESDLSQKDVVDITQIKQHSRAMHIMIIVFIMLIVIGLIAFGVYLLQSRMMQPENVTIVENTANEIIVEDLPVIDDDALYAKDIPNYFSFDVESPTAKNDIKAKLDEISVNMEQQDENDPIAFVVTDKNDIPVSFHVFAMSSGMNFPEGILSALEENFEIYAFNDPVAGVRFGFVIDVKNVITLPQALRDGELLLPQSFGPVIDLGALGTDQVVFKDNSYGGKSIRFANLNQSESYSIDYSVANDQLIVGTSKNTLRAIMDDIQLQAINRD
jgi:hypothetical protein